MAAVSATDAAYSESRTATVISNEKMNDIIKIVNFLKKYDLLIEGVSETIKNEAKQQNGGFLNMKSIKR